MKLLNQPWKNMPKMQVLNYKSYFTLFCSIQLSFSQHCQIIYCIYQSHPLIYWHHPIYNFSVSIDPIILSIHTAALMKYLSHMKTFFIYYSIIYYSIIQLYYIIINFYCKSFLTLINVLPNRFSPRHLRGLLISG
jgi:hypothetical protein